MLGDTIIEPELVKELTLITLLTSHHPHVLRRLPRSNERISVRWPSQALFRQHWS
jgi:hypothetical protein